MLREIRQELEEEDSSLLMIIVILFFLAALTVRDWLQALAIRFRHGT